MFGKKPSVTGKYQLSYFFLIYWYLFLNIKDQAKAHSRELKRTDRELGRDRHKIEAEEQRLVRDNIFTINTYWFLLLW